MRGAAGGSSSTLDAAARKYGTHAQLNVHFQRQILHMHVRSYPGHLRNAAARAAWPGSCTGTDTTIPNKEEH